MLYERNVSTMTRTLIISTDIVGPEMAGPGIRAWELARVLSGACSVMLAAPGAQASTPDGVPPAALYDRPNWRTDRGAGPGRYGDRAGAGVHGASRGARIELPLAIDLYDPELLESLHFEHGQSDAAIAAEHRRYVAQMTAMLRRGDFFFAPPSASATHWLGALSALGRINGPTYAHDQTLRSLIDLVPSGIPPTPPAADRPALRGVHPAIGGDDVLFLWAGGLWHWFDPQLIIRRRRRCRKSCRACGCASSPHARPNPYGEPYRTPTAEQARNLAAELVCLIAR